MAKLKQNWLIILIVLIIAGGLFYWFQWRPAEARKECNKQAIEKAKVATENQQTYYDVTYQTCLRKRGLEK